MSAHSVNVNVHRREPRQAGAARDARAWIAESPLLSTLLLAGIAALLLYAAMDLTAGLRYDGYSFKSQTISELSAVGASTRRMWVPPGIVYSAFVIAFGAGVLRAANRRRPLAVAGALLMAIGVVGLAWPFAPMHSREVLAAGGQTTTDQVHLAFAGVDVLLSLLTIGFAAAAFGKRFRCYSVATVLVLLIFGILVSMDAPSVQDNDPTPWAGVTERINVYGFMLWSAVLGLALLWERSRVAAVSDAPPDQLSD